MMPSAIKPVAVWDVVKAIRRGLPVLGMQLRASSRRRRTYVARLLWVTGLLLFVVLVWSDVVGDLDLPDARAASVMRAAEAGKRIVAAVVWFLFAVAPVAAVILTSGSFAEELRRGSLPVLMTTPLSWEQIVVGKLLSRMMHLGVLVIAALPMLALVRVFGGVPWGYVVGAVCVTLSLACLGGAISTGQSARERRGGRAIFKALAATVGAGLLPGIWLGGATEEMQHALPMTILLLWPAVCAVLLLAAAGVLARAVRLFRLAAATAMGGESPRPFWAARGGVYLPPVPPDPPAFRRPKYDAPPPQMVAAVGQLAAAARRRRRPAPLPLMIRGSPIVWRMMRGSVLLEPKIAYIAAGMVLAYSLFMGMLFGGFDSAAYHVIVMGIALVVVGLYALLGSAAAIASERESGCWPLLLTTPLTDGQILAAKVRAILWRCGPAGAVIGAHAALSVAAGKLHLAALWPLVNIAAGAVGLLVGVGLYFSTRLRKTTTAMLATAGTAVGLWVVLPMLLWLLGGALAGPTWEAAASAVRPLYVSPFVQLYDVVEASMIDSWDRPDLYAPAAASGDPQAWMLVCAAKVTVHSLGQVAVGVLLAVLARRRFRRDVF